VEVESAGRGVDKPEVRRFEIGRLARALRILGAWSQGLYRTVQLVDSRIFNACHVGPPELSADSSKKLFSSSSGSICMHSVWSELAQRAKFWNVAPSIRMPRERFSFW